MSIVGRVLVGLVLGAGSIVSVAAEVDTTSTIIVNARIVDGTGAPARKGAVRLQGDWIVAVGELESVPGEHVVDAGGLTLTPGFIDTHSHHDRGIFEHRDAMAAVSQGITTIVAGQDGGMTYPVKYLFDRLQQTPAAINVASYIGHGNIREFVMNADFARAARPDEIERMRRLVSEGMGYGALGLATGLEYDPGIYSTTDEILVLAKEAAAHGGRYISHIRSEDRYFWAAVDEIVRIGREAKIPVQISHMKLAMVDWWGQSQRLIDVLERARSEGVDITGDIYPYEYWQSNLGVLFPARDFSNRETAEFVLKSISPPDGLLLTGYPPEPALEGLTVAQIAERKGTTPAEALMDLTQRSAVKGNNDDVIGTSMRSDDVAALTAWPYANICSDGSLVGKHPRGAGAFTKVLRVLRPRTEAAQLRGSDPQDDGPLRGAHGLCRSRRHPAGRPRRPGPARSGAGVRPLDDRASGARSVGISKVWVNGVVVLYEGEATGHYPGQVIRRAGQSP